MIFNYKCTTFKNIRCSTLNYIQAKHIETVSFDIFDTLLHRKCDPDAVIDGVVFWLTKALIKRNIPIKQDVLYARQQAYIEVMNQKTESGLDQDMTLSELCPVWLSHVCDLEQKQKQELVEALIQKETELELDATYANIFCLELLQELKLKKIKVIFISDMYLGNEVIKLLLEKNGFKDLYNSCYVSGDINLLKKTGRLFEWVIKEENLNQNKHLHIGDNFESDYKQAVGNGLHALHIADKKLEYKKNNNKFDFLMAKYDPNWKGYAIASYCNSAPHDIGSYVHAYAKKYFGPIFTSFIHKTIERCIEEQIDNIYFLSREGFLLGLIYNEILDIVSNNERIDCVDYFYASRLTTYLAAMNGQFGLREIRSISDNVGGILTLKILFSPLKIKDVDLLNVAAKHGFRDINELLPHFYLFWTPFINLINDKELLSIINKKSSEYKQLLLKMLEQNGFFNANRVAIVDVGWGGQIQENLYTVIKDRTDKPDIIGIYMATNVKAHNMKTPDNWVEWAISDQAHLGWQSLSAFDYVQSFEAIARAPHGTVIGYNKDEKLGITPIFKNETEPSRQAESEDDILLGVMQQGILEYARSYKVAAQIYDASASDTICYARTVMDKAIRFPSKMEAMILLSLRNSFDLGVDDFVLLGDPNVNRVISIKKMLSILKGSFWQYGTCALLYGHIMQILYAVYQNKKNIPKKFVSLAPGIVWCNKANYEMKHPVEPYKKTLFHLKEEYIQKWQSNIKKGINNSNIVLKRKYDGPVSFSQNVPSLISFYLLKLYFTIFRGHHNLYIDGIDNRKLLVRNIYRKWGHKYFLQRVISFLFKNKQK